MRADSISKGDNQRTRPDHGLDPWLPPPATPFGRGPSLFNSDRPPSRCVAPRHCLLSTALHGHIARAQPSLHTLGRLTSRTASSSSRPEHLAAGAARRCSEKRPCASWRWGARVMRSCPAAIVAYHGGRPSGSPWSVLVRQGCGEAASPLRACATLPSRSRMGSIWHERASCC